MNNIDDKLPKKDSITPSEEWLFDNPDVLKSVQQGLLDAEQGKVSKVDLDC